jgi:hypothetical protein
MSPNLQSEPVNVALRDQVAGTLCTCPRRLNRAALHGRPANNARCDSFGGGDFLRCGPPDAYRGRKSRRGFTCGFFSAGCECQFRDLRRASLCGAADRPGAVAEGNGGLLWDEKPRGLSRL